MNEELERIKKNLLAELEKRVEDKILERSNANLLEKLICNAESVNEAISIAQLGTTYKKTGLHYDKRLEKQTNEIKYFKNLLYIRERAFTNCSNLVINEISLPNVLLIELSAFANCTALGCELLNLPSCETLGTTVFYNSSIKKVVMPKLKTIADSYKGYGCFQKIPNLESVTLRDIEYIGDYSFSGATKLVLDSIEYNNLTRIGTSAFGNCTFTLNKAILPNCKKIETSAFYGCISMTLTSLEIPLCTTIGYLAFHSCSSMKSIELPSTVTFIGGNAFQDCTGLTRISITAETPPSLGSSAFANCSALTGIYVPDESVEAYKTATNWSAYANIILPLSQYKG